MPIYEYHCESCDVDFERLVRSAAETIRCPDCAGQKVRRKLSVFGMSSKGRGGNGKSTSRSSCASCRATSCAGCRR